MPGTFATDLVLIRGAEVTTHFTLIGTSVFKLTLTDDLRLEGTNAFYFASQVQPNSCFMLFTPTSSLNLSGRAVFVADIANGGTGYAVSNVLTIVGGTGTAATLTVASVSGGVITSVTITTRGNYTADPTNPASVTGGAGSGATFNLALSSYHAFAWYNNLAWSATAAKAFGGIGYVISSSSPPTIGIIGLHSIGAGGSGYSVSDVLTLTGGTFSTAATFTVTSVSSGAVTGVSLTTNGSYTVEATQPQSTTVAPAGGSGCTLNVVSGLTNSKQWHLAGKDTDSTAGWVRYAVDLNGTPTYSMGTDPTTAITRAGLRNRNDGTLTNKTFAFVIDAASYGTGTLITNGTSGAPVTMSDIFTYDIDSTRAWGIVTSQNNIYYLLGKLRFGTTTQSAVTYFADTSQVFVYPNMPVAADFYAIALRGASGFTTTFKLGSYSGGLASGGCTIKGAGNTASTSHAIWTLTASNSNTVCLLYGSAFSEMRSAAFASSSDEIRYCTFTNSGTITTGGATIDNCTFQDVKTGAPISATYAMIIASAAQMSTVTNCKFITCNRAIKITASGTYVFDNLTFSGNNYVVENSAASGTVTINAANGANPGQYKYINTGGVFGSLSCQTYNANTTFFTDRTAAINNATANDVPLPPIQTTTAGDIIYFGDAATFTGVTLNVGTAGVNSGITINWEYYNGSIWTAITTVVDETTGFTVAGTKTINFTAPTDWTTFAVNGTTKYWIRARDSRSSPGYTTAPLGTQGFLGSTVINSNVSVTITIKDQSGNAIPGAEVAIFQDDAARTVVLASTSTDGDGKVSTTAAQNLGAIIIRARQSTNIASFLTDSSGITDAVNDIITTLAANHNFRNGDAVVYSKNGGSAVIGLTAGATYYVRNLSANTLSLYSTAAQAIAGGAAGRADIFTNLAETHLLDPIRYVSGSATGTIGTTAFSTTITLITDNIATG